MNPAVRKRLNQYPESVRIKLEHLRALILKVAAATVGVNELQETLKWNEPAYLPGKSGTTIRLGWSEKTPHQYGMYVSCPTSLVVSYQTLFPGVFRYEGNRGLIFQLNDKLPDDELRSCIVMALRYHLDK